MKILINFCLALILISNLARGENGDISSGPEILNVLKLASKNPENAKKINQFWNKAWTINRATIYERDAESKFYILDAGMPQLRIVVSTNKDTSKKYEVFFRVGGIRTLSIPPPPTNRDVLDLLTAIRQMH